MEVIRLEILTNPVVVSVLVLTALCLAKLNILMSLIVSALVGAASAGIPMTEAIDLLTGGFASNGGTALSYILLGTFASAIAATGLAEIMSRKLSRHVGRSGKIMLLVLAGAACLSQNLIPIHIAFIPILIPPLIPVMDGLKIDRRAAACSLAFGLKAPYIAIPFGFGSIFMGLIARNMTDNGMTVTVAEVARVNWMLGASMVIGLLIAIWFSYAAPREYSGVSRVSEDGDMPEEGRFTYAHGVTVAAIAAVVAVQYVTDSMALAALAGLAVMFCLRGVKWSDIDAQFAGGIKIMGMIAFVMLTAGGFAEVIKATGGVGSLVTAAAELMRGSRVAAACVITLIGLLVTMGIGSSFSTIPVTAVLYVPLCRAMGFSPAATILLLSAAAALGDAGSPASDTTLGPSAGLGIDGQHDHIRDTCIPTFIHYNIPLALCAIVMSQVI